MCESCWEKFGSPQIVTPQIIKAASLVNKIYTDNSVGWPLHTWLDDWNIEGTWYPWPDSRERVPPEIWQIAKDLCAIANQMTIAERASFLALASGYFEIKEGK
jgi:hypothetical protein